MNGVDKVLGMADGSPTEVARRVSSPERPCSRQIVEYWMRCGYVSGSWAPTVNQKFDVPLHELNPTIYPFQRRA